MNQIIDEYRVLSKQVEECNSLYTQCCKYMGFIYKTVVLYEDEDEEISNISDLAVETNAARVIMHIKLGFAQKDLEEMKLCISCAQNHQTTNVIKFVSACDSAVRFGMNVKNAIGIIGSYFDDCVVYQTRYNQMVKLLPPRKIVVYQKK